MKQGRTNQCWSSNHFWTYQLVLVSGTSKKFHTSLVLVLVSSGCFWTTRSNVWKLKASYFWLLSHMRSSPVSISGGLWHLLMQAQPKTSHFWIWVHPEMMIQWIMGTRKCGTHIYFTTLLCPCHLSASATHFYHRGEKKGAQQLTQSKCSGCCLLLNLISPQIIKARWGWILLTTNMTDPLDLKNGLARNNYSAHEIVGRTQNAMKVPMWQSSWTKTNVTQIPIVITQRVITHKVSQIITFIMNGISLADIIPNWLRHLLTAQASMKYMINMLKT
jgi:hypothetical protein